MENFLILEISQRDVIINTRVKYALFVSDYKKNSNFLDRFSKNTQASNFMKMLQVEAEFFPCGWTGRHDEANSCSSQICEPS